MYIKFIVDKYWIVLVMCPVLLRFVLKIYLILH